MGNMSCFVKNLALFPSGGTQTVLMETKPGKLLILKLKKYVLLTISAINIGIMTAGALRMVQTSNIPVLMKFKQALEVGMFCVFFHSLRLVFHRFDGIPMLINNLKMLDRRVTGRLVVLRKNLFILLPTK